MIFVSRRNFLKCSTGLFAFGIADFSGIGAAKRLNLSFSTLGCPDWSLDQIIDFAVKHDYSGIEIRGLQRELDLVRSPYFNSSSSIKQTLSKLDSKKIKVVGLGSSAAMHHPEGADRIKAFDEAKRFIELAHKINCPYVRVFPDKIPKDEDKLQVLERITSGLNELGSFANGFKVSVLMETHGDVLYADDIEKVMTGVTEKSVGLVWDISNMWMVTKESPAAVYPRIKRWIKHTHIKDLKFENEKPKYTLLGEGEVPILDAVDLLMNDNYKGYLSFEWEKLWHPEIAEPEIAFAQYATTISEHIKRK